MVRLGWVAHRPSTKVARPTGADGQLRSLAVSIRLPDSGRSSLAMLVSAAARGTRLPRPLGPALPRMISRTDRCDAAAKSCGQTTADGALWEMNGRSHGPVYPGVGKHLSFAVSPYICAIHTQRRVCHATDRHVTTNHDSWAMVSSVLRREPSMCHKLHALANHRKHIGADNGCPK